MYLGSENEKQNFHVGLFCEKFQCQLYCFDEGGDTGTGPGAPNIFVSMPIETFGAVPASFRYTFL